MSPPGRPKGEYRKAQPEGTPVNAVTVYVPRDSAAVAAGADEVAEALADERGASAEPGGRRYRDPRQTATATPAAAWPSPSSATARAACCGWSR